MAEHWVNTDAEERSKNKKIDYSCPYCGESFDYKGDLLIHMIDCKNRP